MKDADPEVRHWAQWSLACTGDVAAWQALLRTELDAPPESDELVKESAGLWEGASLDGSVLDQMKAAAESILSPALDDQDRKRRVTALEITTSLPAAWVGAAWQRQALATAELLYQSGDSGPRNVAARALARFAPDRAERLRAVLLNDPDEEITGYAYAELGEAARPWLEERLQSALQAGDAASAGRLADLIYQNITSEDSGALVDPVAQWLDAGSRAQCVAALMALTMMVDESEPEESRAELRTRAHAALQRQGIEETWRQFAEYARSLGDDHRNFIYWLFKTAEGEPDEFACLPTWAAELWPDDLEVLAYDIDAAIAGGRRDRAVAQLAVIEERFSEKVNLLWLAGRYMQLERPQDAFRSYAIAAQRDPNNWESQINAGWCAFLSGDLETSIDATRRGLKLRPGDVYGEFNLGLALLARGDTRAAESSYRRGLALVKRYPPAEVVPALDAGLGDLALLHDPPDPVKEVADRVREWLQAERAIHN